MFHITDLAASMIKQSMEQIGEEGLSLRISAKMTSDFGMVYNLGFDQPKEGDQQYNINGVPVLVDAGTDKNCENMVMDFGELNGEQQFIFENPQDVEQKNPDSCGSTPGASSCGTGCNCG